MRVNFYARKLVPITRASHIRKRKLLPYIAGTMLVAYLSYLVGFHFGSTTSSESTAQGMVDVIEITAVYAEAVKLKGLMSTHKVVLSGRTDVIELMALDNIKQSVSFIETRDYSGSPFEAEINARLTEAKAYVSQY